MPESGDAWRQTCAFFGKIMQECFTVETEIIDAAPIFLALLGRDHKAEVEWNLPQIANGSSAISAWRPRSRSQSFRPTKFPGSRSGQEKLRD